MTCRYFSGKDTRHGDSSGGRCLLSYSLKTGTQCNQWFSAYLSVCGAGFHPQYGPRDKGTKATPSFVCKHGTCAALFSAPLGLSVQSPSSGSLLVLTSKECLTQSLSFHLP